MVVIPLAVQSDLWDHSIINLIIKELWRHKLDPIIKVTNEHDKKSCLVSAGRLDPNLIKKKLTSRSPPSGIKLQLLLNFFISFVMWAWNDLLSVRKLPILNQISGLKVVLGQFRLLFMEWENEKICLWSQFRAIYTRRFVFLNLREVGKHSVYFGYENASIPNFYNVK